MGEQGERLMKMDERRCAGRLQQGSFLLGREIYEEHYRENVSLPFNKAIC